MSLTIAQAMKQIEDLGQELAVWQEVEGFLQGFVKQEEEDIVKRVITTERWEAKGYPPVSIVVPEGIIKAAIQRVRTVELEPRREQLTVLQSLSVQETTNGNGSAEANSDAEEAVGHKQGKQEGSCSSAAKPRRAKLQVTPESPRAAKTSRRLVPKPKGAGAV